MCRERKSSPAPGRSSKVAMIHTRLFSRSRTSTGPGRDPGGRAEAPPHGRERQIAEVLASGMFDAGWYRHRYGVDLSDEALAGHFLDHGVNGYSPGPDFDALWYLDAHADVRALGINPLVHYLRSGRAEQRATRPDQQLAAARALMERRLAEYDIRSSGLFDAQWYRAHHAPDLSGDALLAHYLDHAGDGRSPGPNFDAAWYYEAYPDVREAGLNPLLHYVRHGRAEGRAPRSHDPAAETSSPDSPEAMAREVLDSGFFDADWYRRRYDLGEAEVPIEHFLAHAAAGHSPGPMFDSAFYLEAHPDIRAAGLNPLVHYVQHGRDEGREMRGLAPAQGAIAEGQEPAVQAVLESGFFDAGWYRRRYGLQLSDSELIAHFIEHAQLGYSPGPLFDSAWYLDANPDIRAAGMNPLLHYVQHGRAEGRDMRPEPETVLAREGRRRQQLARQVLDSGFFDAGWYRQRYGLDLPDDLALAHFMDHARHGHSPGPLFDTRWYLDANPDVRDAGLHPLLHYLDNGRAEGRSNCRDLITDQRLQLSLHPAPAERTDIAVVIHAFYPDLFDEMTRRLRSLPPGFTLHAGVTSGEHRLMFEQAVRMAGLICRLDCRVVPNRGRNFSTLLVQFGREIADARLVLHLHTKKSLYSGRQRDDWRDGLLDGLVGSPAQVAAVLELFDRDLGIGLVYPSTHEGLPYWAHHWLSNEYQGGQLMRRLGVESFPRKGYFGYPVGGMFWARTEALAPLLALGLTYDDFPEEAGQTDGTLAHAIERVVGLLPRARGFGSVVYDRANRAFLREQGPLLLEQYAANTPERLAAEMDAAELVSFDIFDTLVMRSAAVPDSVMRLTGAELAQRFPGADDFFARRKAAEHAARAARHHAGDVDLDEIYAAFARDAVWAEDRIAAARELEVARDLATLRARPGAAAMLAAARAAGRRVVAISDTYYTRAEIEAILAKAGFAAAFDALYISSEQRARKDRGDLWGRVAQAEGVESARWLHVGDNEQSDVQSVCDRGMKAFHVMHPAVLMELAGIEVPSHRAPDPSATWPGDLLLGPAMAELFGSPFPDRRLSTLPAIADADTVGYTAFGPVVFQFLAWIIGHPACTGVDRLFFFAREGLLLHRVYARWRERFPELRLPEGRYLPISRRAALTAALAEGFDIEMILAGSKFEGTLSALLRDRLGLVAPAEWNIDAWRIDIETERASVVAALEAIRPRILAQAEGENAVMRAYLGTQGLLDGALPGVVDIGYSATIQTCLQTVAGRGMAGFYMGSFRAARNVERSGGAAFGWLSEDQYAWASDMPAIAHSQMMEAVLTAAHGQVIGYERTAGGEVVPRFAAPSHSPEEAAVLEAVHAGAARYCEELADTYGPALIRAAATLDPRWCQQIFHKLALGAIEVPDSLRRALHVEDNYSGKGRLSVFGIATPPSN